MWETVFIFKAWDEYDHHSLIITKSNTAGLAHMAFKVENADDLAYYEKKVEEFGCITTRVSKGMRLAEGEAVRFILPTGHACELYYEIESIRNSSRHSKSSSMAVTYTGNRTAPLGSLITNRR